MSVEKAPEHQHTNTSPGVMQGQGHYDWLRCSPAHLHQLVLLTIMQCLKGFGRLVLLTSSRGVDAF